MLRMISFVTIKIFSMNPITEGLLIILGIYLVASAMIYIQRTSR